MTDLRRRRGRSELRRDRPRISPRWALLLVGLVVVLATAYAAWHSGPTLFDPVPTPKLAKYPELLEVDPALVGRIGAVLDRPTNNLALRKILDGELPAPGTPAQSESELILAILAGAGPEGPKALIRAWLDRDPGPDGSCWSPSRLRDEIYFPLAWWLRQQASPQLDPILLRIVADRDRGASLRRSAMVAVCRPGHGAVADPVVDIALDPTVSPMLRQAAIERLPRLKLPLPERFADLLYLSSHRFDQLAAGVLASTGDLRAPSLIVEGLRGASNTSPWRNELLVRGVQAAAGEDPLVAGAAEHALESPRDRPRLKALAEAFERWLAARPGLLDTPFEQARREYRTVTAERRDLARSTWEEIREAPEADLDFGAALLHLAEIRYYDDERVEGRDYLEPLDRLCRLVARDLEGKRGPDEVIPVLKRRLQPHRDLVIGWAEDDLSTFLPVALDGYAANCAGLTALYVAVADRLDLPIHAVAVPAHIFVRWDDGKTRRNLELTAGGVSRPDSHYMDLGPGRRVALSSVRAGVYLRNLTQRETLGHMLHNNAVYLLGRGENDLGSELVERALELAPLMPSAIHARAMSQCLRWTGDPAEGARAALAELERARTMDPLCLEMRLSEVGLRLELGEDEDAERLLAEILALAPGHSRALVLQARCRVQAGRGADALALLDAALAKDPENERLLRARLQVLAVLNDPRWREDLALRWAEDPWDAAGHLAVAAVLLAPGPGGTVRVDDALALLAKVEYLDEDPRVRGTAMSKLPLRARECIAAQRPAWYHLNALALDLQADTAGAAEMRKKAELARKATLEPLNPGWWELMD